MSNLIKPDNYISHYAAEKQMDPDATIVLRQYQRHIVDAVDAIVELAHGQRDFVTSESDWKVIEALLAFFAKQWPHEFNEFRATIPDIRSSRKNDGYTDNRETLYAGAIPPRLMKLVKAIFPAQQWDKKFISKFIKRFPLFKVGGA